ncbi:MAG TPA: hypothetical protein VHL78_03875 [Actinomycetota bacterium]|nr:hypothetical protein [Actinomycetota bacterium]
MRGLVVGAAAFSMALAACGGGAAQRTGTGGREPGTGAQGPGTVEIRAVEYAFEGVPASLPSGATTFVMRNVGQEPHMIFFVRIEGTDMSLEELFELSEKRSQKFVEEVGGIQQPVAAGKTGEVTLDLETGRYAYVCFVSAPDGDAHYAKGMFGELTVT